MNEKEKKLWNDFYADGKYVMRYPGEPEIKFFGRMTKDRLLLDTKALDFGCGIGRDLLFMKKLGIDAVGLETSKRAVEQANNRIYNEGYDHCVTLFDGKIIPFEDNFFDFIVSFGVLDHLLFSKAKEIMREFKRVLKDDGMILLVVHSHYDSHYGLGEKIEDNTFKINFGEVEVGLPQHYFTENEVKELVKNFELKRISLHEDRIFDKDLFLTNVKDSLWVLYLKKGEIK